jgi:hypothetical protein
LALRRRFDPPKCEGRVRHGIRGLRQTEYGDVNSFLETAMVVAGVLIGAKKAGGKP